MVLLFGSVGFALEADGFSEDSEKGRDYIKAVERIETYKEALEKELIASEGRLSERRAAVDVLIDVNKERTAYHNQWLIDNPDRDGAGAADLVDFHRQWLGYLTANRVQGINKDEGPGEAIYEWMRSRDRTLNDTYHWLLDGSLSYYDALHKVHVSRQNVINLSQWIAFIDEMKSSGLSESEYDEMVEFLKNRPTYKSEPFAYHLDTRYDDTVLKYLRDIGEAYSALLEKNLINESLKTTKAEDEPEKSTIVENNDPLPGKDMALTFVKGLVQVKRAQTGEIIRARRNMILSPGDTVYTGKGSYADLGSQAGEFAIGGHDLSMPPLSRFTVPVEKVVVPKKSRLRILVEDAFDNATDMFKGNEDYEIETPSAVVGIRGTDFWVLVDAGGNTEILLNDGSVFVKSRHDDSSVILEPGQKVTVNVNKSVEEIISLTPEDKELFEPIDYESIPDYYPNLGENEIVVDIVNEESLTDKIDTEKDREIIFHLNNPSMQVNGRVQDIDGTGVVVPALINDRTLVPVRALVEALGGTADWYAAERKITISVDGEVLEMWLDSKKAVLNGTTLTMDVAPYIENGRSLLPVRFVSESIGCTVDWEQATKKITIKKIIKKALCAYAQSFNLFDRHVLNL
jgi:hypothetical protein